MATLQTLKLALRYEAQAMMSPTQPLSNAQYRDGFDIMRQCSDKSIYEDFIIPQLDALLTSSPRYRNTLSVLEIGPGPESILGALSEHVRQKIRKYVALEPNTLFTQSLKQWLASRPFPCLESPPDVREVPFTIDEESGDSVIGASHFDEKFDIILFCHSMYGMKFKDKVLKQARDMLVERPESGMVVVFHRDGVLQLDDLVCHKTASFPAGVSRIQNVPEILDCFTPLIAGFVMQDVNMGDVMRRKWREVCCALARRDQDHPEYLLFSSPNIMVTFTRDAAMLPALTELVPLSDGQRIVKNREAHSRHPVPVVVPEDVQQVQTCVQWALAYKVGLTVIGGGHSGHCLWPNVVSVDMAAFNQVHVVSSDAEIGDPESDHGPWVLAGAGCNTGDIIRKAASAGLTVPLGSRPSVGAGLWLQGGFGHMARSHGLACDAIVGAVLVTVDDGRIIHIGHVPSQYRPASSVRPENEKDLLWAIKGAGTNFGIVVSVTFRTCAALSYSVRNWVFSIDDDLQAQQRLGHLDQVATKLARNCSVDGYLFWDNGRLCLGVTVFESATTKHALEISENAYAILGSEHHRQVVDGIGLFDTEMYISLMHGGHSGGKTSSFKRCIFLKHIGIPNVRNILVLALKSRPSRLCYLHLLQGGGAIGDLMGHDSAFGCRNWDFACVITGVWPRNQDGTTTAQEAIQWVYQIAMDLLPLSNGAYGADLGPDPRDAPLARAAFGSHQPRLSHLKSLLDPYKVLAYACPLQISTRPKLIILVTGKSCAGKDYCATFWASLFDTQRLKARAVSISEVTKQEYAAATGADLNRLLCDRGYKEQHRPALTQFFHEQVQTRPQLPEDQFVRVVRNASDVDVLFITGMRDEAPVATFSQLVPNSKLLELRVQAKEDTRRARREFQDNNGVHCGSWIPDKIHDDESKSTVPSYRPDLVMNNDINGKESISKFAHDQIFPFLDKDLDRLSDMVRSISDFPRPGIKFRDVLGISQQRDGLSLCTSLLKTHFSGDWTRVETIVCCEAGGFVFASALAAKVNVRLALIREAGKLPPPTVTVSKPPSHISNLGPTSSKNKVIEMSSNVIFKGSTVVVVDDVLATGMTLCAVLQLLQSVGVTPKDVTISVVAEFPVHGGRALLRREGFGEVKIESLLVFGDA
ncbi:unnamed protein product [Clonostachys rosea f. rosea IK726]|uniref:FAD-binding PCMH-type domain-containing protein n=2 Tax=Bionectria ochroleuca TaxID=29856 RepID=A0A0B7K3L8_BIOOC|nr:unnamed protein product [Clonostachys rosea f. rosea IK726]